MRAAAATVLVTGGAGFIGASLVRRLEAEGRPVRVLDDLSTGRPEHLAGTRADLLVGDLRSPDDVARAVAGVEAVVHLAAVGSVPASVADPLPGLEVNVRGTWHVLEAARRAGVQRVVAASTGGALAGQGTTPVDESTPPRPLSPYGASKAAAEAYCSAYAGSYGLRTVVLRFANVYGPFSSAKTGAVTRFLQALRDGRPLVVNGDGSAVRDFLHVDDVCDGVLRALAADLPGGTVLQLGTGVATSVRRLAELCCEVAGRPGHPVEHRPALAGEVSGGPARIDLAARVLGFRPRTTLPEGLQRTWRWYVTEDGAIEDGVADGAVSVTAGRSSP